jgi:outer membrane protein assembly factor BamD (BamD/ComL family)
MFSINEYGMVMKKIFSIPAAIFFIVLLFACESKTELELFESAQNNIKAENYSQALMDFEQILEKYGEGKYAGRAILEIGKLYHGKVIKNLTVNESMHKAVEYYERYYENYPKEAEAQQALFMSGFILANEIKDYLAAREVYTKFINEYPNSELSISAKAELDNLGKDPEEILQSKISTSN